MFAAPDPNDFHKRIHFSSDPHFWHSRLATIRGFSSVEEMNEKLIDNWNKKVRLDDTVYLLGDVSFAGTTKTVDVLERLNGKIHLIRGNHDRELTGNVLSIFASVKDLDRIKIVTHNPDGTSDVQRVVLCHFPLLVWDMAHHGAWHLHGHSHGSCRYPNPNAKILDVGMDPQMLRPISFDEVSAVMAGRSTFCSDYHGSRDQDKENA